MTNDTDAIDIEELGGLLEDASTATGNDDKHHEHRNPLTGTGVSESCVNCLRVEALRRLANLAPRLAARVVADATKLRDAREALEAAFEGYGTARLYDLIHHGSVSGKGYDDTYDQCRICDMTTEWRYKDGKVDKQEHREGCIVPALAAALDKLRREATS